MSTYKYTYFNGKARGEPTRLIFVLAGQKFEDNRIEMADWPKLKPKTLLGQLPYLEVDGATLGQSAAIARFVAKRFGLYGKNDLEQAKGDMVVDCVTDVQDSMVEIYFRSADANDRASKIKSYKEGNFDKQLSTLERFLNDNGFSIGSNLSWADLHVFNAIDGWFASLGFELDSAKYPRISKLMSNVKANANIAAYLSTRPQTPW